VIVKAKSKSSQWEELAETPVSALKRRGIHMDIIGAEGEGKSSAALTLAALGPIAYINIDHSVDRARYPEDPKSKKNVKIHRVNYATVVGEAQTKAAAMPAWNDANTKLHEACKSFAVGAVVDTVTEDWELLRLGVFGTVTPKGRTDRLYGPVNAKFRNHLRDVTRVYKKHLITLTQLKDEYKDVVDRATGQKASVKTGKKIPVGFKEVGYLADIRLRVSHSGPLFTATVEICKIGRGPVLEGHEFEDDEIDFANIIATVTGTKRKEWL
jgi:hypothetical protein